MDWANVIGTIVAVLAAILLPLAFRKRKKGGLDAVEQLFQHLLGLGSKASLVEKGMEEEKVGVSRAWGRKSEGLIEMHGGNIDYIYVTSTSSQYGVRYSLDYLVRSHGGSAKNGKKTRMVRKRSPRIWGKVVDIAWKGDDYLSRGLNFDYQLKDRLLLGGLEKLKGTIWIFPEPKLEYARVRTDYLLPSSDLFQAIDIIAGHIKSVW